MQELIQALKAEFQEAVAKAATTSDLEALKVRFLGKKGPIQDLMKELRHVEGDCRRDMGKLINTLKEEVSLTLSCKESSLQGAEEVEQQKLETLDVTLPGRRHYAGRKHVITQALDEMIDILVEMGFSVQYGPEVETDYYNFEALNFAPDHPARDMQDTFYIEDKVLLRTHTTNIQARILEKNSPPVRIIMPGKVYRNEAISVRSHVFFHQIDGVYIDKGVTFGDLMVTMEEFLNKLFKTKVKTRFRPSYFPFVEPGMEVDIHCLACNGGGCPICKKTGWLEVLGAGMVHPEVLKIADIDPEEYSGYAWGLGVERLVMLRSGIKDIRMFTENDYRFLRQFTAI